MRARNGPIAGLFAAAAVTLAAGTAAAAVVERSGLRLEVDDANGTISSVRFRGNEYYREGAFASDFGLQLGRETATFAANAAAGRTDLPTSAVAADGNLVRVTGTYDAAGGTVTYERSYLLTSGGDSLRVGTALTNEGTSAVRLRLFETFDPDQDRPDTFDTANDVLTLGANRVGRAVGGSGTVVLGGPSARLLVASGDPALGIAITSGRELNAFFAGPFDPDGSDGDFGTHLGWQFLLKPGETKSFISFQGYGLTSAAAEDAFLRATPVPAALPLMGAGLAGLGFLARRRRRRPG